MQKIISKLLLHTVVVYTALFMCFSCGQTEEQPMGEVVDANLGSEIEAKLEPLIQNVIEAYALPGMAIGVVKENKIAYARGFGHKHIDTREPITATTLFHMASISKPFVATAIMQLVEQGKIDLDALVTAYIPYFKLADERYKEITIQQMLSHVSGMPDVMDYEWDNPVYDEGALERYVRSLTDRKMRFDPGTKFAYSNMAFECLGDVIAKVSGMSFADYEKKHILDRAGMKESTFLKPDHLPENWAAGHLRSLTTVAWDGYPYNRMHGPSSTLHSNAIEMCNWAITNINRGSFEGNRILETSSYDLLWKPWFKTGAGETRDSVGLSWFLGEYRGEKSVGHGGGDVGFNTYLIILPEKALAVVVLCNYIPAPVGYLTNAALDICLGFEPEEFKPPAGVAVGRILVEQGVEAAAAEWNSIKEERATEYNADKRQLYFFMNSILELDQVEEAKKLALFYTKVLPEQDLNRIIKMAAYHQKRKPENKAAPAMLKILEESQE
jgi:CubicO group peptidase (beta-lactamase class C family)